MNDFCKNGRYDNQNLSFFANENNQIFQIYPFFVNENNQIFSYS